MSQPLYDFSKIIQVGDKIKALIAVNEASTDPSGKTILTSENIRVLWLADLHQNQLSVQTYSELLLVWLQISMPTVKSNAHIEFSNWLKSLEDSTKMENK